MENELDDQGSGWLEVKKKHRGNSKFFVQSWVGGFSVRSTSSSQASQSQSYDKSGNLINKRKAQLSKARGNPTGHCQSVLANSITTSSKDKAMCCDEKCVVEQDNVCEPSPSMPSSESNDKTGDIQKHSVDEKHNVIPKIKWGDLDDDSLVQHHGDGVEIKFGNIGDGNVLSCEEFREKNNAGSSTPQSERSELFKLSETPVDTGKSHQMLPSTSNDKEEPGDVQVVKEKIINPTDDFLGDPEVCNEHVGTVYQHRRSSSTLGEEDEAVVKLPVFSEVKDLHIPAVVDTNDNSVAKVVSEDTKVVPPINDKCEDSEAAELPSVKYFSNHQGSIIDDGMAKVQNLNASEEDDSSESKERFRQRLWCFLFENLNRAIDELYLLCELECDLEQMKEAILVLEEAASDFKELTSRVEKFEKVKKPTSVSADGVPITLMADHRRPHALSWEVRRMTTSPHRAEILSSSIEAFRKIQQQRLSIYLGDDKSAFVSDTSNHHYIPADIELNGKSDATSSAKDSSVKIRKQPRSLEVIHGSLNGEKQTVASSRSSKTNMGQNSRVIAHHMHAADANSAVSHSKDGIASSVARKSTREQGQEGGKLIARKEKTLTESSVEKHPKHMDHLKRQPPFPEKDKEKRTSNPWKTMDAWKEKRNWEDILSSPFRVSSRISHSPGISRKSAERARTLHDKLMSPEKKKKNARDLKKEAEEKHARAMRIRSELEQERMQKLQRTSEKLTRVNEWQAVRHMKLREGMYARHQRSESRHEAYLARVARRAGDESSKVNEVRFITSLNEENKKLMLRQKLQDSEMRRAEKLQVMKTKQKEDLAREEAVLERRKLIEAEKLQRLAETQRKKEEAQVRREEERRASSAAREARAMEQLRRKEVRAKAQQEEAELLAQKLAEKLSESEQRRKFYLEQIKERASMDFRDQSSPLLRRSVTKEAQGRITPTKGCEDSHSTGVLTAGCSSLVPCNAAMQQSLKRRIKRIRQKLMALKYEFSEPPLGCENTSIGYRTSLGTARAKIGRWIQDLQKLRQARKEGAASIGMITREIIKFVEGKELELHASRQSGLIDFIASALPASHTSKPEACQVTIHLLKLLKVVLAIPANRSYFLVQNLLPPIIPMLSAALENYIKIAASLNVPGSTYNVSSKTSIENFESMSEVLDGFLWTVTVIIGHVSSDDRQLQMRESLLELLIAYQVIHRLRDLFALYDRPQVEGSPFPSSIVLSINLLVVLTSRPEMDMDNNINWEFKPAETHLSSESQDAKSADCGHSKNAVPSADQGPCLQEGEVAVSLPAELEDSEIGNLRVMQNGHEPVEGDNGNAIALDDSAGPNISGDLPDQAGEIMKENTTTPCEDKEHPKDPLADANEHKDENTTSLKKPLALLLSAISETGLVCLPSLLTSVLLQANNRLSLEQASYVLPSNFEEVATGVLKFLNNLAYLDIAFMQKMLARLDLKMEFFHLMSFLLSYCNSKWGTPKDQVGLLLLESLLLLGHFALFHPDNQAVLRWGNSPTILHKVCDLPFVFFSDPELMPVLAGTLVAACYGCEQNKGVIQQELSVDMLLSLLKSCRNAVPPVQHPAIENLLNDSNDQSSHSLESRKIQADKSARLVRCNARNSKINLVKGNPAGNNVKSSKRKERAAKIYEDSGNHYLPSSKASSVMLHCRFPSSFIDRAEKFFSAGMMGMEAEVSVEA